ncbi:MAG: hypothetical protein IPI07_01945 [Flavobacteriales bacterium]|nr:hypothetical protein [Flavobacteriales bacterium]
MNYHRADATDKDTVYYFEGGAWQRVTHAFGRQNTFVSAASNQLLLCQNDHVERYSSDLVFQDALIGYSGGLSITPAMAVPTLDGTALWIADRNRGLVRSVGTKPAHRYTPGARHSLGAAHCHGRWRPVCYHGRGRRQLDECVPAGRGTFVRGRDLEDDQQDQ